jgi:hypothetical protein
MLDVVIREFVSGGLTFIGVASWCPRLEEALHI